MRDNFTIVEWSPNPPVTKKIATAKAYGTPLGFHATDVDQAITAATGNFLGYCRRAIVAAEDLKQMLWEEEQPYVVGDPVTIYDVAIIEVEDAALVKASGGDALGSATAVGTLVGYHTDGTFHVAANGETAYFKVTGNSGLGSSTLAPRLGGNRLRLQRIEFAKNIPYVAP